MSPRVALFLVLLPVAAVAANRPPNYDALADLPDKPAFTWGAKTMSVDPTAYVAHVHDTGRGAIIVKYRQRVDGIEVFRSEMNVAMTRDRKVIASSGGLFGVRRLAAAFAKSSVAAQIAITDLEGGTLVEQHAVWFPFPDHLEAATFVVIDAGDVMYSYVISSSDNRILFRKNLTEEDAAPFTYRVWADPSGIHRPYNGPQGFNGIPHPTGLNDGFQAPLVPQESIALASGPISTHDPWLAAGATQTSGNNADAYVDLSAPDGLSPGDFRATTSSANTFDFTYDVATAPDTTRTQQQAVVTQLFYDVNFFHDWYYDSGFNEAAGNGQNDNYGRGGVAGDALRVEAQDFSGRNNANMSTPPDGSRPKMQVFIWDGVGTRDLAVDSPSTLAGHFSTGSAVFGQTSFNLSGDVSTVTPVDACTAIRTPLNGKIAFIDRGTCPFAVKTANAQAAGAIAAIIGNVPSSQSPDSTTTMGCSVSPCPAAELTLPPALHLSLSDANAFRARLAAGGVHVTMRRESAVDRDGGLDNEIVAHEWGHYLSNRLIANGSGLTSTQSRGMGEGWSDFLALLFVARAEDSAVASNTTFNGAYAAAQYVTAGGSNGPQPNGGYYFGVRRVPYSTDMSKDPLTLKHISKGNAITGPAPVRFGADGSGNAEVHATGEVWASMLWECYAALLRDTLGAQPRLTFAEAQQRMRDYIVASLKMTPANPTLLDGRDALLAVAFATDATDFREFWEAFAKRGAGIHAVAGQRFSTANAGAVDDFSVGADATAQSISLDDSVTSCAPDGILGSGESGLLTVTLRNTGNARLQAATATVSSSDSHLTFAGPLTFAAMEPGQTATASVRATLSGATGIVRPDITISVTDPALTSNDVIAFQPRLNAVDQPEESATDDVESKQSAWSVSATSAAVLAWSPLQLTPQSRVWQANEFAGISDSSLTSPLLVASRNRPLRITFRHRYWFDTDVDNLGNPIALDGGVVEISNDDGKTWTDAGTSVSPGYGELPLVFGFRNPLQGRRAFVGTSPGASLDDPAGSPFTNATLDLGTAYAGQRIRIRFRIATAGSHSGGPLLGWQIDDIAVSGITNLPFFGLVADRGICTSLETTTTVVSQSNIVIANVTAGPAADGTVDFLENGNVVASVLLDRGVAIWNAAEELAGGTHTIVASFAGTKNFKPSMSTPMEIHIVAPLRHRAAPR